MRRLWWLMVLVAAACPGRPPVPDVDILLRVWATGTAVTPGKSFSLTVQRVWLEGYRPGAWDDRQLAPLVVQLEDVSERHQNGRVEEVRRYRAYLFAREKVVLEGLVFRAISPTGGNALVARAEPLRLMVVTGLTAKAPGDIELPGPPLRPPGLIPNWVWGSGCLVGAGLIILFLLQRRRETVAIPVTAPRELALDRLGSLGATVEGEAFFMAVEGVVRDFLTTGFAACSPEMTTADLLGAELTRELFSPAQCGFLARFLHQCDLVKFGMVSTTTAAREKVVVEVDDFLRQAPPCVGEEVA